MHHTTTSTQTTTRFPQTRGEINSVEWLTEAEVSRRREQAGWLSIPVATTFQLYNRQQENIAVEILTQPGERGACEFLDNLYIGNQTDVIRSYANGQSPYKLIVNFAQSTKTLINNCDANCTVSHCIIEDGGDNFDIILNYYKDTAKPLIEDALANGHKVLIACRAGMSRSATFAIIYLMDKFNITAIQAFHYLRHHRAFVHPDILYMAKLVKHGHNAQTLPIQPEVYQQWATENNVYQATYNQDQQVYTSHASLIVFSWVGIAQVQHQFERHHGSFIHLQPADHGTLQTKIREINLKRSIIFGIASQAVPLALGVTLQACASQGLLEPLNTMYATMMTGGLLALGVGLFCALEQKNLRKGIATFIVESGLVAGLSYACFTFAAPMLKEAGLSVIQDDMVLCATLTGVAVIVNAMIMLTKSAEVDK